MRYKNFDGSTCDWISEASLRDGRFVSEVLEEAMEESRSSGREVRIDVKIAERRRKAALREREVVEIRIERGVLGR